LRKSFRLKSVEHLDLRIIHFFKTYGFEGEYWGSYMGRFEKLEPGIYKVVVVGVDAKTGEYNSVVAFSEPFKTEEY